MAEVVLRSELDRAGLAARVEVDSAGTGDWHIGSPMDSRARAELAIRGYDGSGHRARQFRPSWFDRYDLVAAMDSANLADLRAMAPDGEAADRIRLFRSFDPALAVDLVHPAAKGLAAQLAELLPAGSAGSGSAGSGSAGSGSAGSGSAGSGPAGAGPAGAG